MIKSFAEEEAKALFEIGKSRRWSFIRRVAVRKLVQINAAATLVDLNVLRGTGWRR